MTTAPNAALLPSALTPPPRARRSLTDTVSRAKSAVMFRVCVYFTVLILATLAVVTGFLTSIGAGSLSWSFFTELPTGIPAAPGGMKHAIVGSGILIGLASAVGIPVGLLAGVYLAEYEAGSWIAAPVRFTADVLAGVPSIVVGILGYELLVRPLGSYNGWAGAAALAFIMIPIAARTTEEMLRLVPNSYREASLALGASKARTIVSVVLPAATGSVVTGVMLAIARVAGETAPLLFTAGISRYLQTDPSEQFPSLTVQITKFAEHPTPETRSLAWGGILVLISLIFLINLSIRVVTRSKRVGPAK
ncbi:MAG: phosphate transporter rane protein 2, PhoT family [Phycisphaerales bacterium]|nr:phosphate transporter rane protein 2, PhoT family [Phycisphaerales bacterium]